MVSTVSTTIRAFLIPYARHFRDMGWSVDAAASGVAQDQSLVEGFDRVHEIPLSRSVRDVRTLGDGFAAISRLVGSGYDIVPPSSQTCQADPLARPYRTSRKPWQGTTLPSMGLSMPGPLTVTWTCSLPAASVTFATWKSTSTWFAISPL